MSLLETVVQSIEGVKRRLLDSGIDPKVVESAFSLSEEKVVPEKKILQDDGVYIVKNYGRTHALFGPFNRPPLKSFNEEYLKPQKWITQKKLAYGLGWMLLNKEKLGELIEKLKEWGIKYQEMERGEFDKHWRQHRAPESTNDEGSSQPQPGFVMMEIFDEKIAVGTSGDKGLTRLTSDEEKICRSRGLSCLSVDKLKEWEKKMEMLRKVLGLEPVIYLLRIPVIDNNDKETAEIDVEVQFPSNEAYSHHKKHSFRTIDTQLQEFISKGWEGDNSIKGKIRAIKKLKESDDCLLIKE